MALSETSRIIKARAARQLSSSVPYNFDDLRRECDEHVAEARRVGEEIIARATARADETRRQAHEEGYAAGRIEGLAGAQGLIESHAEELAAVLTEERLKTLLPALEEGVGRLELERERWLSAWEAAAIRLSAAIARRIVRRELSQDPEVAKGIVRAALELAAGQSQITLRLHPGDLERLRDGGAIRDCLQRFGEATLVADDAVSPGGCVIDSRHGLIDARIETQLQRIVDELLGNDSV